MILLSALAWAVAPHESLTQIVTANGYGAAVWVDDRMSGAWPRLYSQYDEDADETYDLLYDSYSGATDYDGEGTWFTNPDSVELVDGTNIIQAVETWNDLEITEYAFAPSELGFFGLAEVYRIRNASLTAPTPAFQFTNLHNWETGGYDFAAYDSEQLTQAGGDYVVTYRAPGADTLTCESGYDQVTEGGRLLGECGGSGDAPVFGWNIPSLTPGGETWVGVLMGTDVDFGWMDGRPAEDWLLDELAGWEVVQAEVPAPADLSSEEAEVWRQQVAWLRMAQVQEDDDSYGQIPASLPAVGPSEDFSHVWNITWVRDESYSVVALARSGQLEQASAALRFLLQDGKAGGYADELGGVTYALSVCRTYGDGTEQSDDDGNGPNVELDNFGTYLWALDETVSRATDTSLLEELGPTALDGVADPLVALIDPDNGLLVADSSIWESHWNGYNQQYAYSSIEAVAGLRAAADLATRLGDDRAATYSAAADGITTAIQTSLVDSDGVIASSVEQLAVGAGYLDLAAVEAFNQGVLDPKGPELTASFAAWDTYLTTASTNGYFRNDDGADYDNQEWAFIDLRASMALRRACRTAEADALLENVTQQALSNHRAIPELYTADEADYAGPAPMLGFGAGAWMIAVMERAELDAACPVDTGAVDSGGSDTGPAAGDSDTGGSGDTVDTDTGGKPPGGCGCAATPGVAPSLLGLGAGVLLWRGRRARDRRPIP